MTPTRQEIKAAIELGICYLSTAGDTKAFPAQKALRAHLDTFDAKADFEEAAMARHAEREKSGGGSDWTSAEEITTYRRLVAAQEGK